MQNRTGARISRRCLLGGALATAGMAAAAADKKESRRIPVLAWVGPPSNEATPERYRELAECGFTDNFSGFPNLDAMAAALDVAQGAGIRAFISVPELVSDPEGVARRFRSHPALGGYHLRDEPSAADFPALADQTRRIQSVDREHGCYINLFPNYATPDQLGAPTYGDYVDRFLSQVPVPYFFFVFFTVIGDHLRPNWYENLEIISQKARSAGKPFWAFVLAVAHGPYPIATVPQMRVQAFSDLAYGAQCIQYFTYWTPDDKSWNFHQAPIEKDGKRTPVYDRVRQVNEEIRALSPVFLDATVESVGHTGEVPKGARAFEPGEPIREVHVDGGGVLISRLRYGKRRYAAFVNRDFLKPQTVNVGLEGKARVRRLSKTGATERVRGSEVVMVLEPGDLGLLTWE